MKLEIGHNQIGLAVGDISDQTTEAIVNAANSQLAGGGGVDGAIHRRGGPAIMQETNAKYPTGCATGQAVISGAGELKSKFVIHAVGPIWKNGKSGESELLASAYKASLQLACDNHCSSIAFPAISCGAYQFPLEQAAGIAIETAVNWLNQPGSVKMIRFVLFDQHTYDVFAKLLHEVARERHS